MHLFDEDTATLAHAAGPERTAPARQHADGIASAAGPPAPPNPTSLLHLQRTVGNAGVVQMMREGDGDDPHGLSMLGSGGSPLDTGTRVQMESAIGADFSDVRVHTGSDADQSAKSFGAHAYTAGSDIVFAEGRYDPGSTDGQKTLAHELTHVVQQRQGPVDGSMTDTGVKVSDPSDSFEQAAVANAERITGEAPAGSASAPEASGAAGVQRHADDDHEVQGLFVQRETAEEEPDEVQGSFAEAGAVQREADDDEDVG